MTVFRATGIETRTPVNVGDKESVGIVWIISINSLRDIPVLEIEESGVAIAENEGVSEFEGLLDLDGSLRLVWSVFAAVGAEIARLGKTEGIHLDFE